MSTLIGAEMTARARTPLACAAALSLLGWGISSAAPAEEDAQRTTRADLEHVVFEDLGTNLNAVDGWYLLCPAGTHHAHFDIHDGSSGGPTFGIVGYDFTTGKATIRRAPQGGLSTSAQLNYGSGEYDFYVFKAGGSTGVAAFYDSDQRCHSSSHADLGGTHGMIQDQ
jgi:hypothetical protein